MKKLLLLTIILFGLFTVSGYSQVGFTCNNPIQITTLPYSTTDNTANYGDTTDVTQPAGCAGTTTNYMTGNDVFYAYTPTTSGAISVTMIPTGTWSGVFVYNGCGNVGVTCLGGVANSGNGVRSIPSISVVAGQQYIIVISTNAAPQTIGYTLAVQTVNCAQPTTLSATGITQTSANLSWGVGAATSWEVAVQPSGSPIPSGAGIQTNTNVNYLASPLSPNTQYQYWVRANCGDGTFSAWAGPYSFMTLAPPLVCGETFTDTGGPNGDYANNADSIVTICPTIQGDPVTVTFTSFNTEVNYDALYVFNGNSIQSPQIASTNGAGSVPGGLAGGFWGTTIPGPFTSTDPSGCLTFRFRSDATATRSGWIANVTCATPPTCPKPISLIVSYISPSSVNLGWTETSSATQWEVLALPFGAPAPTVTTTGIVTSSNPYTVTGLSGANNAVYTFYVRAICSLSDSSDWSFPSTYTMPVCNTPTNIVVSGITPNSASISWTSQGSGQGTQFEILVLPTGSPIPTVTSTGNSTLNPYLVNGLTSVTVYDVYVRRICSSSYSTDWSTPISFTTLANGIPLTPNTTLYSPQQLVTNVLINNPCVQVTNVTSSTGTNFGTSDNGIGYFSNTNPTFPLTSGIVLSTGNATSIPGPNTSILSDGDINWPGDTQLENIISAATGNTMESYNATKLEFDFTSLNEFMSFNFLFASEEYGTFQCAYADAFAFLLTDITTGITTNIAVVPGTTTPISVITIRNNAYNTTCTSVNANFFDQFFTGTSNYLSATNFNGQTHMMTASSPIIPNNPYHVKLVIADRGDELLDSAIFIQEGSFTTGPPECVDKIRLLSFIDENNNGVKDTNEHEFTYGNFSVDTNNSGVPNDITSPLGVYTIYYTNPTDVYDFSYSINPEFAPYYTAASTAFDDIAIVSGSGTTLYYFPVTLTQPYNDLSISISPFIPPRPGMTYKNKVVYTNLGVAATSGTITFTNAAQVTITSVSQTDTVPTATGFTYAFSNLAPFETRSFYVTMSVPNIPTVNIGDILTNSITIASAGGSGATNDVNLANNTFSNNEIIVAAYDPNDNTEAHGSKIQHNQFTTNDYLHYTVRFQNNGTTNAIKIRIEDILDPRIDEQSLRVVSASHNYILERVNNHLTFKFDYIQLLPYSLNNAETCKGYITFKIKLKPGFAIGDIIPNTANIYFDTNPPIITNTFNTEFVQTLGTTTFTDSNLVVYPNPATSYVQIALNNSTEQISSVIVYDMLGKKIMEQRNITANQTSINTSALSKGMYLIEIKSNTNMKLVKKLIIQ